MKGHEKNMSGGWWEKMEWIQLKRRTDLKLLAQAQIESFVVLVFTGRGQMRGDGAQLFFMPHFIFWFQSKGKGRRWSLWCWVVYLKWNLLVKRKKKVDLIESKRILYNSHKNWPLVSDHGSIGDGLVLTEDVCTFTWPSWICFSLCSVFLFIFPAFLIY